MKKKKIGLLPKIVIAIALGIVCGLFLPGWLVRIFLTINGLFSNFLGFIIPLLIPLALRGVKYKPIGASALLRRNLFIYGLGGIIVPFIGIKLIDMLVSVFF